MHRKIKTGILHALIASLALPLAAVAAEDKHQLELKLRGVYWDDDSLAYPTAATPNPTSKGYTQSALGVQLNYKSPYFADIIGADVSLYGVTKIDDSGTPTSNLLDIGNNGRVNHAYLTAGQALIKLKYEKLAELKLGRQLHNSLLLRSTATRAVPDTYQGASGSLQPLAGLTIYGAVYDQWRARSTGHFEKFRTEATAAGVPHNIDYIGILGATYAKGPFSITAEFLNSKDYLKKYGLVGAYTIPLDKNSLKLSGGILTSSDAGSLFVCSAERELDCTGTKRIDNDGRGIYVDGEWKVSNFTVGAAIAKFDGNWIEDNFAVDATRTGSLTQDHGTSPFPTSAGIGPDLTNRDELVGSVRLGYDFKDFVPGLKASYKYSRGSGAKSSNLKNNAEGKEHYREFNLQYALPFLKNLNLRYSYLNYDSNVDNFATSKTIKGMSRQDWDQHRFYVDYSYQF